MIESGLRMNDTCVVDCKFDIRGVTRNQHQKATEIGQKFSLASGHSDTRAAQEQRPVTNEYTGLRMGLQEWDQVKQMSTAVPLKQEF
jgi:hypothetical protein